MLTWINAGCDVGLGLPKCQAMHPTSVWVNDGPWGVQWRLPLLPVNGHSSVSRTTSEKCQEETHTLQQIVAITSWQAVGDVTAHRGPKPSQLSY
jgi:hypothetical protein